MIRFFMFLLLVEFGSWVSAESLYLQSLQNTKLTDKQIKSSLKKVTEHKALVLRESLEVPPFHKRNKATDALAFSFCTTCHISPPHTKNERTRTFMNMHTQYIACETCHFRPENVALSYQWQDTQEAKVVHARPELFRQEVKPKPILATLSAKKREAKSVKVTNPFYKITPYYQGAAVTLGRNNIFARETKKLWQQVDNLDKKAERRALIHAPLSEKGPQCKACHSEKHPLLNFSELGATPYQVEKIQNNIIAQFFASYKDKDQRIRIINLLR